MYQLCFEQTIEFKQKWEAKKLREKSQALAQFSAARGEQEKKIELSKTKQRASHMISVSIVIDGRWELRGKKLYK
jgi:hypothetical protein